MISNHHYEQKIEYARASLWVPYYAVGMAARIHGTVTAQQVKSALARLQILYPPLASRVLLDEEGKALLTTKGVGEFCLEVRPRLSDTDWEGLFLEQERIPFNFNEGPVTRFFLLQGESGSDLIAIAPHVVCDGYSMTQVMSDVVALLNNPAQPVSPPEHPPAVTWKTVRHAPLDDLPVRCLARLVNCFWPNRRLVINQETYEELHRSYWQRQHNHLLSFTLSTAETTVLAARSRQHGVSVTGALVAAYLLAQEETCHLAGKLRSEVSVAVNLRDRLVQQPGRAVGVYASNFNFALNPVGKSFWELAKEGYARIRHALANRPMLLLPLVLEEVDPSIVDALVASVASGQVGGEFALINHFLRIQAPRWLDVSNIGRIDLPEAGGPFRLENLLPFPPLVPGGALALNVMTVGGQMNVVLKHQVDQISPDEICEIKRRALAYLLPSGELST